MDKYINDDFTGSIDDLLNHCANLDVSKVEEQVKNEEKEECIKLIMQELECEEDEALKVYNEIALSETKTVVDKMVKDGLLEIIGHNEDGEPLFSLTELGKAIRNEMEKGK
jgi:hypothetical protein